MSPSRAEDGLETCGLAPYRMEGEDCWVNKTSQNLLAGGEAPYRTENEVSQVENWGPGPYRMESEVCWVNKTSQDVWLELGILD